MKHILLVEDHKDSALWLKQCVTAVWPTAEVAMAHSFEAAQQHIEQSHFDFALLDIRLPDGSGIELIPLMKQNNPHVYCVMATIFNDEKHIYAALQAGAQGYLLKDQTKEQICNALRSIESGQLPIAADIARRILNFFQQGMIGLSGDLNIEDYKLTARELEVLTLLAKGVSRKEIAKMLNISPNTIAGYVKNIYQKLEVCSRAEAAVIAQRAGLV